MIFPFRFRGRRGAGGAPPAAAAPDPLHTSVTQPGVEALFELMLGRPVADAPYVQHLVGSGATYAEVLAELRRSKELSLQVGMETGEPEPAPPGRLDGSAYATPPDLQPNADGGGRCLLIGACLMDGWPSILAGTHPAWTIEGTPFANVHALPARNAESLRGVDFQILHIPLRFVLPDHVYLPLIRGEVTEAQVWPGCLERLGLAFETLTTYARDFATPAFLLSFLTPQRHPLGRFGRMHATPDPAALMRALNAELQTLCRAAASVFFYDLDETVSLYGRKYFQDDSVSHTNHGGVLVPVALFDDADRLEPVGDVDALYAPRVASIVSAVFEDIAGAYRALQQTGAVKLVVFDLDDTLWRGVAAEQDELDGRMTEGWPLAMVEAVATLHARGVLVALVSKNDPQTAERAWRRLHQAHFPWEAFFAHDISWGDKGEAIGRIIETANILPDAVLFVDDNPAERERARGALPGLRVIDAPVAEWKRILLWSPELQPAVLTAESRGRASLQPRPPGPAGAESREAFLARLNVQIAIEAVESMEVPAFARVFELLNKTNQFNTTGRRWTLPDARSLFDTGGRMLVARVSDAHNDYGLTAIAVICGAQIVQMVMSCRVFGLGVEGRLLQASVDAIRARSEVGGSGEGAHTGEVVGRIAPTGRNVASLRVFEDAGFVADPREAEVGAEAGTEGVAWRLAFHPG